MPTVQTITVRSGGLGDYSSLSAAEAGEQANLVTGDVQLDIECYAFADTTAVTVDGWTTDATRYVRIFTPTAERHDGKWDTSAYRLYVSGATFGNLLSLAEDYTRVEGIQVRNDSNFNRGVDSTGTGVLLDSCLVLLPAVVDGYDGVKQSGGSLTVRNCVVLGGGGTSGINAAAADNCTVVGWGNGFNVATARNCYSGNNTGSDFNGGSLTTCASEDATGTGGLTGVAYSTANFTSVTGGSEDLHLVSGSALRGVGTDLSGTFTEDIDGDTRSAWDIGADEFQGVAGGCPLVKYAGGVQFMHGGYQHGGVGMRW
jgi:hypothetical protein